MVRSGQVRSDDGQTPWSSYKKQLEAAVTAGSWEEEQKATTLVLASENKADREVKIRSLTRGSGSSIPGKIYENPAAITIDTGAEVSIVRKGCVRAEDVEPIAETVRLKIVTVLVN
ncbi:hypothetical protein Zmor_021720 [Zophobas morio]|uniref:Uncharacterized protein n=1 Tax=Zophobas morio TaxID=2755281 RepID=A0AA38I974_9CUCU|nr:hypothetical protein Zmor_021720 [Zophobas morio]